MSIAVPERSLLQRREALDHANYIRIRRAILKRRIRSGSRNVSVVLQFPPDYVLSMKIFDLLKAIPGFGPIKVNKILAYSRISPAKTVGGLTQRQRLELISRL